MMTRPFGQMELTLWDRRRRARLLLLAGVSLAVIAMVAPAKAETITFAEEQNNADPIEMTEDTTLVLDSGVAYQAGAINANGHDLIIEGPTDAPASWLALTTSNPNLGDIYLNRGGLAAFNTSLGTTGTLFLADDTRFATTGTISKTIDVTGLATIMSPYVARPLTLSGQITGTGGLYLLTPGSAVTLNDQHGNTYSGGTLIDGDTTAIVHGLAPFGTGEVTVNRYGTISYKDVAIANEIDGREAIALHVGDADDTSYQNGRIGISGEGLLQKTGAGSLVLGAETALRKAVISEGRLVAASEGALTSTADIVVEAPGTLALADDQVIKSLNGDGTLDLGSSRLSLGFNAADMEFSGAMIGDADAAFRQSEASNLTLSGDGEGFQGELETFRGVMTVTGDYGNASVLVDEGGTLAGSGRVGDLSVEQGYLYGTAGQTLTVGDLSFANDSIFRAALGTPGTGALVYARGDLVLDGRLRVEDMGGFGPGIYRLIDYDGALENRGLDIFDVPDGTDPDDLAVQTSVDHQVNLVNGGIAAGDLLFWDGDDSGLWNNGAVDGGSGIWNADLDTFTDADGAANGGMNPSPGFVIFQAEGGTVTLENDAGMAQVTGMQFAADGYTIAGDALDLAAGDAIVRVGDGSAAGAGYVAHIASELTGLGRLSKTDLGTLVLDGDSSFTGGTEVRDGTLVVNGSIGDVDVLADGRLGGMGSVGNADIAGGLAATMAATPLSVNGDLTLHDASILEVEVDADGNAGLIDVSGTAHLAGEVMALASGGDYNDATTYTILTADGGIDGSFADVGSNLAFLNAALAYNANDVQLTLTRNGTTFENVGETFNQKSVGAVIEAMGDGTALHDRVLTLDADDARGAFDALSGEIHASARGALIAGSSGLRDAMAGRVEIGAAKGFGVWSQASGHRGTLEGDGNAGDATFSAGNLFIGGDAAFNQNLMFGFALGYGQSDVALDGREASASADNYHIGAYGGGSVDNWTFKFGAGYTGHAIQTSRNADFAGFSDTLTADYSGHTVQAFGELGYAFQFDSGLIVEPYANLAAVNLYTGSYDETGGAAALSGKSEATGATLVTLGLRGKQQLTAGETVAVTLNGGIAWTHTFADTPEASHAFAGSDGFAVRGAPIGGDALKLDAGLDIAVGNALSFNIGYTGQIAESGTDHAVTAGLSAKF